jgi:transposase-like protein
MAEQKIDYLGFLRKLLERDEADALKGMVKEFAEGLMGAEADQHCGASFGERSDERRNSRNGYRTRGWDTRVGTIDLAIPRLRKGSYYPEWLLERGRRAEKALVSVITEAYVHGVSTRKVEDLVQALGVESLSKSQVSELARGLDATVEAFRRRPLDGAPYGYVWLDALFVKCREEGRVVSVAVLVAVGVNADGRREILGVDVSTSEDGSGWLAFLRGLVARGLSGVKLVISDAHGGLRDSIASALPGAAWQRCRTHFMRNLLQRVPRSAQGLVGTLVRTVFAQPDAASTHSQMDHVIAQLQKRFPKAAELLEESRAELLAFTCFPKEHWRQIWSNNPQERLNKEIRRRTDVVGIFPNREAVIRLVGAILIEQHDEWTVARRYLTVYGADKAPLEALPNDMSEAALLRSA